MQTLPIQQVRAEWHVMGAFTVTMGQALKVPFAVYFVFFITTMNMSTSMVDIFRWK